MLIAIIKAFIIGICASAPLGPCAIMILQKSLGHGRKAGLVTAMGATVTDTLWAAVSIFALALAEEFIDANQNGIYIFGGFIVAMIGISMVFKDPLRKVKSQDEADQIKVKYFLQALATALSNPAAIFVMLGLFAFFNVDTPDRTILILPVIFAVTAGSVFYWYFFTMFFSHLRKAFKMETIIWINRLAGIIIFFIGISACLKGVSAAFFS